MTFHNLFKSRIGGLPLFMAYDLKQGPNDSFLNFKRQEDAGSIFKSVGAGNTELVELTKVFRSTPQITKFLADLDASFPALDLPGEWGSYQSSSEQEHGQIPTLSVYGRNTELLDEVFKKARRVAGVHGGRQVAVLCLNDELFGKYLRVGRISTGMVPISSREQVHELRYAGKRCVFSAPDYVAGLQFHTVFLIHVDQADFTELDSIGARRRFVSRCYLGASRAACELHIACAAERGGPSDVLNGPLQNKSLRKL
jgi:hypothetical protein